MNRQMVGLMLALSFGFGAIEQFNQEAIWAGILLALASLAMLAVAVKEE